jgi:hypothetical protein
MLKTIFALSLAGAALAFVPAHAGSQSAPSSNTNSAPSSGAAAAATNYHCTAEDMAKLQASMEGMTDAGKKAGAMKEMAMAKDSMGANDEKSCLDHMRNLTNMFN